MPQSTSPRTLIGYISLPVDTPYFAIPIYKNTGTRSLEFHILDEQSQKIIDFDVCNIHEDGYTHLSDHIRNKFKNILPNSLAIFIIVEPPTELFVGTINDVREEFDRFEERHQQKFFFLEQLRQAVAIKK